MKKLIFLAMTGLTISLQAQETKKEAAASPQVIEIKATEEGYVPSEIDVTAGTPVTLKITRTSADTCATEIKIKDKKVNQKLPLNETVTVNLGSLKKGDLKFNCGMDMFKGVLHVK